MVVMELSSDKYCPCVISENLLKESLVSLEMDWQSSQFGGMVEPGQGTKKRLSNVEVRPVLFDFIYLLLPTSDGNGPQSYGSLNCHIILM